MNKPSTYDNGRLRSVDAIEKILGKKKLRNLGFDVPRGEVTAEQATMLNRVKEEMPSASDIAKADDIGLQEIAKSTEDLITQGQETLPMLELLGLNKQLRSIRGLLKVEVAKRFSWKKALRKTSTSSKNYETILRCVMIRVQQQNRKLWFFGCSDFV